MRIGIAKFFSGLIALLAFSAMARAGFLPNQYELHGRGVHVVYSSSSLTGESLLTYSSPGLTKSYRGQEITEESTAIGTLVTVTTEFHPDVNYVTFSVLIPEIHVFNGPERFSTEAFITNHSTPFIAPPGLAGPVETYSAFKMSGKASSVAFLAPSTGITGTVSLSTCATTPPSNGCFISPFSDAGIEVLDVSGNVIAKTVTNIDGVYSVDVASGSYVVHVLTNGIFPACPDAKADVPATGTTVADVLCTAVR